MSTCQPRVFDPNCPHRLLLDQITDKWSVLILTALDEGPARFNAIKRRLDGVTQKALTQSLRRLERNGLVARRVVTASPVAVEYRITSLARTLLPPVRALYAWTVEHLPQVDRARAAFDGQLDRRLDECLGAAAERAETERLLAYDPSTAGGLMTTEFVYAPETLSVEEALRGVRAVARTGRKEAMSTVYTTDAAGRLAGVLSLRELLAAREGAKLGDVAWTEVRSVPADAPQEEVARIISDYDLLAVPVVDADRRLLGVVTVDDVIDVIQEEQTEDVQKLGGMEALDEPYMQIGLGAMIKKRAGWLSALFLSEMLTASAMQRFEGELEKAVVLTLFIPLVMSSGGNSGSQATSLITRAMALKEVRLGDWWRVALRELPAGLTLGTILGLIGVVRITLWQRLGLYHYGPHWALVAATVGCALVGIVTFGSLAGSMLPFVLRRLGFDPASASAPFVATLVDVTGLSIYFSVAYLILHGTLL